jgi:hypothetical protein
MKVEELRDLARAAEPLSAGSVALDGRERIAYRDLVSRFRERIVSARNSLMLGQDVQPELEQELRLLARELPALRRRAEAGVQRALPIPGE